MRSPAVEPRLRIPTFKGPRLIIAVLSAVERVGYLARARTLNKRFRISCVTITPRGRGVGGRYCIASGFSVKQQLAHFFNLVILRALKVASVAQLVEQKTLNLLVEGSNPSGGTRSRRHIGLSSIGGHWNVKRPATRSGWRAIPKKDRGVRCAQWLFFRKKMDGRRMLAGVARVNGRDHRVGGHRCSRKIDDTDPR